jgi:hypothetical protein
MSAFFPIRELPKKSKYNGDDTLVIFGEVFERGYVNGLIKEAQSLGMNVIYSTVGRHDKDGFLRKLNNEELSQKNQSPMINVPLEAGFDLEKMEKSGLSLTEHLNQVKLKTWKEFNLDNAEVESALQKGRARFKTQVQDYLTELENLLPDKGHVIFAHTMAGGIPKSKIVLSLMNRILKGFGDRFSSSEDFVKSNMGQMCEKNFNEVTGETLQCLVTMSEGLRKKLETQGRNISYVAYGYHGTDIHIQDKYEWYSYTPYIQGRAKRHLESISKKAFAEGVNCCVYNVPEILTNSSGIFQGIELAMYPLLQDLKPHFENNEYLKSLFSDVDNKLKDGESLDSLFKLSQEYFQRLEIREPLNFDNWPQENAKPIMDTMREYSQKIIEIHKDQKEMVVFPISEVIFKACGKIILHSCEKSDNYMQWIGHDVILKSTLEKN